MLDYLLYGYFLIITVAEANKVVRSSVMVSRSVSGDNRKIPQWISYVRLWRAIFSLGIVALLFWCFFAGYLSSLTVLLIFTLVYLLQFLLIMFLSNRVEMARNN